MPFYLKPAGNSDLRRGGDLTNSALRLRWLGLRRFGRVRTVGRTTVGLRDGLFNRLVRRHSLVGRNLGLVRLTTLRTNGLAALRIPGLAGCCSTCALPLALALPLTLARPSRIGGILGNTGSKPLLIEAHAQELPFAVVVMLVPSAERGRIVAARNARNGEALDPACRCKGT